MDPRHDCLILGLLQHQSSSGPSGNRNVASAGAIIGVSHHACKEPCERGFPGTGGSLEQNPLPWLQNEIYVVQGRLVLPGESPRQRRDLYPGSTHTRHY